MSMRLFLLIIIFVSGVFLVVSADAVMMSLKDQLENLEDDQVLVCWNFEHVLVLRPNDKYVCVEPYTAMKLDWNPTPNEYLYHDVELENGEIFTIFAHNTSGAGIENIEKNEYSLIIDLQSTNSGKVFIEIPRKLLDPKYAICDKITEDSPDDQFFVLVNNEEVYNNEIFTTDTHRTLEFSFEKNVKQIEIIETCLV